MMSTPAFQFYPKDWLSSQTVSLMSLAQEGAYIRLLAYAWQDENCGIPDDPDKLARLLRISREEFDRGGYNLVIGKFQPHPSLEGVLINDRLLEERQKQELWRQKSAAGGKIGAAKRWGKGSNDENGGGNKGRYDQNMTLQFAVCSLHNSTPQPTAADIYAAYPRKVGRPKALQAIEKARQKICPGCLLEIVQRFSTVRIGEDPQYTPHPSTWFNQERYNDDPSTWKTNGNNQSTGKPVVDRNAGTYNENYDIAAAARKVR